MGPTFAIFLREGFEAALIVVICLAYLNAVQRRDRFGAVWAGVGAALVASVAVGAIIFFTAGALSHTAQEAFEGVVTLVAVGVLTWMVFWMRRQARHIRGELHQKIDAALTTDSAKAVGVIAFIAVLREGFETALFLFAAVRATESQATGLRLAGAGLGLGAALVIAFLIYKGGVRLNMRAFFLITGIMLLAVAAYLLNYGVHELQEVRWIPNVSGLRPALWAAYLVVTAFLFFKPAGKPAPATPAPVEERTG